MVRKKLTDQTTKIVSEKDQQLKNNLLIPCKNKEHLKLWIKTYLAVDLADCTVSRFASINPMDAAWIIYSYVMYNQTDEPLNILLVAARASQKTLSMAAVELAIMLHDRRDILHYAAAESQAKVGWNYLTEFAYKPFVRDYLETKPTNDEIKFILPDYLNPQEEYKKVKASVLSITLLNAQGQHAPFVSIDELLTLSHDKRKAYYDLTGVPVSTNDGRPYVRAEISSRKGPYSVVEEKMEKAAESGLMVRKWTVMENQKRCPDERSGVIPTVFYGNPKTGMVLEPEQYDKLIDSEKTGFYQANGFENCLKCKIASFCLGDAKKQISKCKVLNSIEKTITDYHNTSLDLWVSQRLSIEPSRYGLIFPSFSRDKHVKKLKEIWEIYTGQTAPGNLVFSKLVLKMQEDGCIFYCGIDHSGGTAPYAIVTIAIDKNNRVFLLDVFGEVVEFDTMALKLKTLNELFKYRVIFPDPASKDKNQLLKKLKFRIMDKFTKQVSAGIELTRTKLLSADGTVSFYALDERTVFWQNEMSKYHFKEKTDGSFDDEPEDEHNHSIDSVRYVFQNIFMNANGKWIVPDLQKNNINGTQNDELNNWFKNQINMMFINNDIKDDNLTGMQDGYTCSDA